MLKLQTKLAQKESADKQHRRKLKERSLSDATEDVARNLTESWVKQHSQDPSEKTRVKLSSMGKEKKRANGVSKPNGGNDGEWPVTVW